MLKWLKPRSIEDGLWVQETLTFVQKVKEAVYEVPRRDRDWAIDLEDPETYICCWGYQGFSIWTSSELSAFLRRVWDPIIEEVVAPPLFNRPGVSDYIDTSVKRKHGQEKVDILIQLLKKSLRPHLWDHACLRKQVMQAV